jgi:uncharacterized protein
MTNRRAGNRHTLIIGRRMANSGSSRQRPQGPHRRLETGAGWWSVQWTPTRLLVFVVALVALDVLCQLAAKLLRAATPPALIGTVTVVCAVGLSAAMIVAYRFLVQSIERRDPQELGRSHAVRQALTGVACGAALFATVELVLAWADVAHIGPYTGSAYLARAVAGALAAAVGEEIVFRGVVFRITEEAFGTLVALVISAALFGLLHGFNRGASVVSMTAIALEAGILLAAAYAATRSLWLPIGLHFGWNFTEGGIFGAAVSGNAAHGLVSTTLSGDARWTGGAFGPEASLVAVGVCLLASVALLGLAIRRGNGQPIRLRMWPPSTPSAEVPSDAPPLVSA